MYHCTALQVFVVKCSAGIDFIPSDMTTLDPQETLNITFDIHSVYTIGKINQCEGMNNNYCQYSIIHGRAIMSKHCITYM